MNKIANIFKGVFENGFNTKKFNYWLRALAIVSFVLIILFIFLSSTRNLTQYVFDFGKTSKTARAESAIWLITVPKATDSVAAPLTWNIHGKDLVALASFRGIQAFTDAGALTDELKALIVASDQTTLANLLNALNVDKIGSIDLDGLDVAKMGIARTDNFTPFISLLWGTQSSLKLALVFGVVGLTAVIAQTAKLFGRHKASDNFINSLLVVICLGGVIGFASSLYVLIFAIIGLIIEGMVLLQSINIRFKKEVTN